jgi:hypothetical protein
MCGPPVEAPPAEAPETEPETHPVKTEDFYGPGPSAAEDEDRAGIGIALELVPAEPGQSINAFAEIHGLDGHQNAHLWRDLNQ